MRTLKLLAAASTGIMALAASSAQAQNSTTTLTVNGTIASYCNINLGSVTSGTASVAMADVQRVGTLRLACNSGGGTTLLVDPLEGDLVSGDNRINYGLILDAPVDAFDINNEDTFPGDDEGQGQFTRAAAFSTDVAQGIDLELSLNMNVTSEPDVEFSGTFFPANQAPAGVYSETFTFTVTGV